MLKRPYTFDEQIAQLKSHGIDVNDESYAKEYLQRVNYYRLTGYALQFRKSPSDSDCVEGTTFEDIIQIYEFDESLRDILRQYLEISEVYYKTMISHWFSLRKCLLPPHDQHYDITNYYNKTGFQEIINSFSTQKNYYHDSLIVKHHIAKYEGKMPLWVIMELMSFSNVSKLYSAMYISDKDAIAAEIGVGRLTLENHLHCLSVLRNKCAHGARLYNTSMSPKAHFNSNFLRANRAVLEDSLFAYILVLIKRLPEKSQRANLVNDITELINGAPEKISLDLLGFPKNYTHVLNNQI